MKKVILTFALLGFIIQANSQYNTQLIDSTKIWSILDQPCEGCGGEMYSFYLKVQGDTTLNDLNYTKIYQALDEYMLEWDLYGFIRQEESKYYLRNMAGEEGLAYDFSVSIGDTLEINNPFGEFPVEALVTNIDSVYIEPSNELRKKIKLLANGGTPYAGDEYWIEGIGSLTGLTVSGTDLTQLTGGENFNLLCFLEEDVLLYKYSEGCLCYYPLVDIPEINPGEDDVSLFPNPVYDISYLKIQNPENKNCTVVIYNLYGKLMQKFSISSSVDIEINSKAYSNGVYFYSVLKENELDCPGKFIIQ
jgi:hypothetical protein